MFHQDLCSTSTHTRKSWSYHVKLKLVLRVVIDIDLPVIVFVQRKDCSDPHDTLSQESAEHLNHPEGMQWITVGSLRAGSSGMGFSSVVVFDACVAP